jgi:hypothetical protein
MTLGECYIVYDIDPIIFDITFDIEREKGLRYSIRYQHTIHFMFNIKEMKHRYRHPRS